MTAMPCSIMAAIWRPWSPRPHLVEDRQSTRPLFRLLHWRRLAPKRYDEKRSAIGRPDDPAVLLIDGQICSRTVMPLPNVTMRARVRAEYRPQILRTRRVWRAPISRSAFHTSSTRAFVEISLRTEATQAALFSCCFMNSSARFFNSGMATSSVCVAIIQLFPEGSFTPPVRSP